MKTLVLAVLAACAAPAVAVECTDEQLALGRGCPAAACDVAQTERVLRSVTASDIGFCVATGEVYAGQNGLSLLVSCNTGPEGSGRNYTIPTAQVRGCRADEVQTILRAIRDGSSCRRADLRAELARRLSPVNAAYCTEGTIDFVGAGTSDVYANCPDERGEPNGTMIPTRVLSDFGCNAAEAQAALRGL